MQNAKDSFYMCMRARLGVVNPERTTMVRGMVRPGIVVEDAEAPISQLPSDIFVLRWSGLNIDLDLSPSLSAQECEFIYQTCGSQAFGGLDRGRALAAMDAELLAILQPFQTPKLCYAGDTPT